MNALPDVMFVIQRVLEIQGRLTLLDQNRVIHPHPYFRLFSTANTVGLGDTTGLYHGTQQINQAQMDRWSLVSTLNYLSHDAETMIELNRGLLRMRVRPYYLHQMDLACGTGRVAVFLASRGFEVTGLDRSAACFRSVGYAETLQYLDGELEGRHRCV